MQEIQVPNNLNLKVYIDGIPDLTQVEETDMMVWAGVLDKTLSDHIESYHKRKARRDAKKD